MSSSGRFSVHSGSRAGATPHFPPLLLPVLLVVTLQSCLITDHSERDPEAITSESLNFPSSGYETVDPDDLPTMTFDVSHFDFGKIVQGAKVDTVYAFKNTGGGPLVITDVRAACGCTVAKDWPKRPLKPGESATIGVSFDSEGRNGRQDKTVTVVANTSPPSTVLTFTAEVVGPTSKP